MSLLKEIFKNEVFPAIGCTEPISCAYTAAAAAEQLGAPVESLDLIVDPGTYKNGAMVTIPYTGGEKGNMIAAAMGVFIARSSLRLEILKGATSEILKKAKDLIASGKIKYTCLESEKSFHVEVVALSKSLRVRCVVKEGHTNIVFLEKDGRSIIDVHPHKGSAEKDYHDAMRAMTLEQVLKDVVRLDEDDRSYIRKGMEMNLAIASKGLEMKRTAFQMHRMIKAGIRSEDLAFKIELAVASGVDARMAGLPEPAMTSGGSGNQGMITILVPAIAGKERKVDQKVIEESIAISHAVNSYIKCFIGELSVLCGCAIAAAISASIALIYQYAGIDMKKITFAMDNVIGDLAGLVCDGAKPGCALKIVSGAEAAVRAAFMAAVDYSISTDDGVVGRTAEDSINNLRVLSQQGMSGVDPAVVRILKEKISRRGLG